MKKLTPFQKKVARWYNRLSKTMSDVLVLSLVPVIIFACLSLMHTFLFGVEKPLGKCMLLLSCLLLLYLFVIPPLILNAAQWRWRLPERYRKDAQELLKDHPEFSGMLDTLIQDSIASDDGSRLAEKLEEINNFLSLWKKLISKAECLEKLKKEILEIEKQIATLEKELGL